MNLVKRVHPAALGLSAAGLAGTASGVVGTLARAARGLARTAPPSTGVTEVSRPPGPNIVLAEPHAPDEPPVDVVGMALAAEADALRHTTVDEVDETAAALEEEADRLRG